MTGNLHPRLDYVGLVVIDRADVARVFGDDFGLRRTDCPRGANGPSVPVFSLGRAALALFEPDDPMLGGDAKPGVHHIALAVDDLDAAVAHAARNDVPAEGAEDRGLQGRRLQRLSASALSGVRTYLSEALALEPAAPGPVERLDHVGVASADNGAALDAFCSTLGFALESTQTDLEVSVAIESFTSDKYGVVQHSRQPEIQGGLRVAFVTVGDCDLEFLQDLESQRTSSGALGGPGTTKQDQSAIARYIASRGAGLHHIALKVRDIDGTLAALHRAGRPVIDRVGRPGSRRALIGFLHPRALHGVLVHLVQRDDRA